MRWGRSHPNVCFQYHSFRYQYLRSNESILAKNPNSFSGKKFETAVSSEKRTNLSVLVLDLTLLTRSPSTERSIDTGELLPGMDDPTKEQRC